MRRVVISGPTGEIGIALIRRLVQEKIEVLAICRPGSHRRKLIPQSPYVKVVECDLSDLKNLSPLEETYDVFYHFGWCASYGAERENLYLQNRNVEYELDAVDLAARLGCKKFIGAGTQAEYGRKDRPLTPDMETTPETAYGAAKLCAGHFSKLACKQKEIVHIWVRICSVYGFGDGPNTLITYIMQQLEKQEDIELTPCQQQWDYLYAGDAAEAFYRIGMSVNEDKVYCLGSGQAKPLYIYMQEVERFARAKGVVSQIKIGAKPYGEQQMMYLCADIDRLQRDIGTFVSTDFYQGLEAIWQLNQEYKKDINMELQETIDKVNTYIDNPTKGLPEEVLLFLTENTPMVNVDLLIRDKENRILLSWRDDEFCGCGWHVPGGIIRLKETLEERIQKTALNEIGCTVTFDKQPLEVRQIVHKEKKTRGHFITFIYECRIPEGNAVDQKGKKPGEAGFLQWHDEFPEDMIEVHDFYKKYFNNNK